jgi:surface antigen
MISDRDHELLMAYVDGELDEPGRREVEARLAADPEAAALVATLRRSRDALAATMTDAVRAAPDDAVRHNVEAAFAAAEQRGDRRLWVRRIGPAVAAAAASLAVGLFGGYQFALQGPAAARSAAAALVREDRQMMRQALHTALESKVSGTSLSWRNPDSGSAGTVTPVRTFKSTKGQWCREYKAAARYAGWREDFSGIACRGADARWRTVLRAPRSGATL